MTEKGIYLIKLFEGCKLTAYQCPAGVWTIGYGHTEGVKKGDIITQEQADEMLQKDILTYELNVTCRCEAKLNPHQIDALTSLAYNVGVAAFSRSTLLKVINRGGTEEEIRKEFSKWVYGGGRVMPGLVRRRAAEADLYFTPMPETYDPFHKCNYK